MTLPSSGPLSFSDIQTEFGGSNPIGLNEYYAGGGLVPSGTTGTYGAVPTSGQISVQNFYGTSNYIPVYIEELFSTYLYSGNSSTQTITNGIDLAGKGGIVLFKSRNNATNWNLYSTTSASPWYYLSTLSTEAIQTGSPSRLQSFNSNGFTLGADYPNYSGYTFASWTFRKQPKFFDVVTYTGNGGTQQNIPHNLQAYPGLIIVKRTDSAGNWYVCPIMQSNWNNDYLLLNSTAGKVSSVNIWQSTSGTSLTTFGVLDGSTVNISGATYVAYLFADSGSGGFGLTGSDNVISCGSYSGSGAAGNAQNLGYEPQWVLIKASNGIDDWHLFDNMRGIATGGNDAILYPNLGNAEYTAGNRIALTATGFTFEGSNLNFSGTTYIYIAIRRGPMKTPTSGTSVFTPATRTGTGSGITTTAAGFPVDTYFVRRYPYASFPNDIMDRLRGSPSLVTNSTGIESTGNGQVTSWAAMSGVGLGSDGETNSGISPDNLYVDWYFRRAPGFFDVVCYTGNNSSPNYSHNLGVAPELVIIKNRGGSYDWAVSCYTSGTIRTYLALNSSKASGFGGAMSNPNTATTFAANYCSSTGDQNESWAGGSTYVAYLFATCAGVSKVGSYTGTGALQTVNCGFTGGARFALIKRTDSTGDWYVYDSARGISSGTDPYLVLNSNAAQVTGTNYVDTTSVGFQVTAAAPAGLNASGGTYIFLAIA